MNKRDSRPRRGGCFAIVVLVFLVCAFAAILSWPKYVDANGQQALAVISQKKESVTLQYGEWFRRFQIAAIYTISGQRFDHPASCDVDERTFSSLRLGNSVSVHYLLHRSSQSFLPASHLSPCSAWASLYANPAVSRALAAALGALLVILFSWRVLRIKIAAWLLVPWSGVFLFYVCLPRVEPMPEQSRLAKATVQSVTTITHLLASDGRFSINLQHPFQIVVFKFSPANFDASVVGIDKVDLDSVPNLKENQSLDIWYEPAHPRIARLRQGTRLFPGQARLTVSLICGAFMGLILLVSLLGWLLRLLTRNSAIRSAVRSARIKAAIR